LVHDRLGDRYNAPPSLTAVAGTGRVGHPSGGDRQWHGDYRTLLAEGAQLPTHDLDVAAITLQVSCALIGMIIGFATAFSTGLLSQADLAQLTALPPLQVPHVDYWAWSFDAVL
jgi:hypothetical protein